MAMRTFLIALAAIASVLALTHAQSCGVNARALTEDECNTICKLSLSTSRARCLALERKPGRAGKTLRHRQACDELVLLSISSLQSKAHTDISFEIPP